MLTVITLLVTGLMLNAPVPMPKDAPKTTAEKVVGKWLVVKTDAPLPEKAKATIEFTKDGKMKLTIEVPGEDTIKGEGTYKVVGETIDYKMSVMGEEHAEVLKIKKLTDDEMVTIDPDDLKEEFKRIKDDKKEEKK